MLNCSQPTANQRANERTMSMLFRLACDRMVMDIHGMMGWSIKKAISPCSRLVSCSYSSGRGARPIVARDHRVSLGSQCSRDIFHAILLLIVTKREGGREGGEGKAREGEGREAEGRQLRRHFRLGVGAHMYE